MTFYVETYVGLVFQPDFACIEAISKVEDGYPSMTTQVLLFPPDVPLQHGGHFRDLVQLCEVLTNLPFVLWYGWACV